MSITLEEVRHVAKLARLELDETEILSLQGELNALLGHFGDLQRAPTGGPAPEALQRQNVWAEDSVAECLPREEALANAPKSKAGLFLVPTIIED